ncbi:TPA: Ni/Fe hydrogenase subunit alpha [Candidatus Woesearchaeota archaeon]|nr:Ni/Fe hydrogenase subunit alpha [Candidatus Woesearchaeota archaeon]
MAKTINLNHLTKVEGHANLTISIKDSTIEKCELDSAEGSRYFEALLKDRNCLEAPEITSRICGICSCAHFMASVQAVERALGVKVTEQTKMLRELLMTGERIRSHSTHLYFLALPDYLGFDNALEMTKKHRKDIEISLRLNKLGNGMVELIGGRVMHPVSAQVGGFLKIPTQEEIDNLRRLLQDAQADALETARRFAKLKVPKFEKDTEYFSVYDDTAYGMLHGSMASQENKFKQDEYQKYLSEYHVYYATAKFVSKKDKPYMVGALSRMNNSYKFLSKNAKKVISEAKVKFPLNNPFMINFCQAVELVHYVDRAIEICRKLKVKQEDPVPVEFRKGRGISAVEAPRGVLWHDYEVNAKGEIIKANIITPTCQNLHNMEEDIKAYLPALLKLPENKLVLEVEKLIRAYDPCFSCSTHFLKVKWEKK